jgi:hypothetical protein
VIGSKCTGDNGETMHKKYFTENVQFKVATGMILEMRI